jgi:hypothetical protein
VTHSVARVCLHRWVVANDGTALLVGVWGAGWISPATPPYYVGGLVSRVPSSLMKVHGADIAPSTREWSAAPRPYPSAASAGQQFNSPELPDARCHLSCQLALQPRRERRLTQHSGHHRPRSRTRNLAATTVLALALRSAPFRSRSTCCTCRTYQLRRTWTRPTMLRTRDVRCVVPPRE